MAGILKIIFERYFRIFLVILTLIFTMGINRFYGQAEGNSPDNSREGIKIEGQWFLLYQYNNLDVNEGEENIISNNSFEITRGYLTFKKEFNKTFSARMTSDVTVDEEGDGRGDIEVRLKYAYLKTNLPSWGFFTKPYIEFGLVHRPWLDFEEHVNRYRVQGNMFIERSRVINSADFGITFVTLFGGMVDEQYQKIISKSYPGRYGSMSFGVYNGGGYHAIESNSSKNLEGRLTLRPLPDVLPGLQFSYHGVYGKGNTEINPDLNIHQGFVSYENKFGVITAQIARNQGDMGGKYWIDSTNTYKMKGGSVFGEFKLLPTRLTFFGRYDHYQALDKSELDFTSDVFILGAGYYFTPKSKFIFDVDYVSNKIEAITTKTYYIQAGVEVHF